jgi:cytochrome c553
VIEKYLLPAKTALRSTVDVFRRRPISALASTAVAILAAGLFFLIGAIVVAWLGIYDVAATKGHNEAFAWFLHFTMRNSVESHAPALARPSLRDPALIAKGEIYFGLRCAPCHGAPGRRPDILAQSMLPRPPNISVVKREFSPDQLHWIIKHGIKMSAMPAWPTQKRDDEIWSLVAYLNHVEKNSTDLQTPAHETTDKPERPGIGGLVSLNTCFACHGSDGNGRDGVFPKLAGLSSSYIETSLKDYRSGNRPSGFMSPFVKSLSDAEIKDLAAYFAPLERRSHQKGAEPDQKKIQQGAKIAELAHNTRPMPACQSCHVRDNLRRASDVPDLASQPAHYLSAQLKLFRYGTRKGTPNAEIMARIAQKLSDADIENVSAYFAARPTRSGETGNESAASNVQHGER